MSGHNQRCIGIDFSLSCPAICIHEGNTWNHENCQFHFLNGNKKLTVSLFSGKIQGHLFKPYNTDIERFLLNAYDIKHICLPCERTEIAVEGYSFGSKGSRLFQIGEATGILKTLLIHDMSGSLINKGNNLRAFAPSAIKKFGSGKGNADKQMMYDAFLSETGIDLLRAFGHGKLMSPCHDLADSYFICKMMFSESNELSTQ